MRKYIGLGFLFLFFNINLKNWYVCLHKLYFSDLTEDQIMSLNLPTGIPFEYELDENFKPVVSMKFLGDEETVKKAIEAVAAQGKAK